MVANRQSTVLIATCALLAGICGCGASPLGSALEGTWQLVVSNPPPLLTSCDITFDRDGKVEAVSYYFDDKATVTWNSPTNEVSAEGDQVHFSVMQFGQGFTFAGTLDSATGPTRATGKLDLNLSVANVDISVLQGDATLIKH